MESLLGIERFFYFGITVVGLAVLAASIYGLFLLKRMGVLAFAPAKKAKPLPKHKVDGAPLDSRWAEEKGYDTMMNRLHQEIQQAIHQQDKETLEIVAQGPALRLFLSRLSKLDMGADQREALQGTVRQSWDQASKKLVITMAVSRWVKGWRRFYEEWTLQRQGNAWFVVDAKPTKI